jgi:hypothetical protein
MEYPKMIYKAAAPVADQEALKAALASGEVQTRIVNSVREEKAATGFTADLASLVAKSAADDLI